MHSAPVDTIRGQPNRKALEEKAFLPHIVPGYKLAQRSFYKTGDILAAATLHSRAEHVYSCATYTNQAGYKEATDP